eukprot:CAMPEP_0172619644 /NCGR_PEP_ID=MMETSP1068-20121228/95296_1 /TAXON_ID=35684 /ORGANISM="Pseudopedinella elastica, Strain CCMP716" /LENGTH=94 /DNA_ID=CAMNT_0013426487 /DNA_START=49 /DNA_END=333 /DNA_ORIENTATION=+
MTSAQIKEQDELLDHISVGVRSLHERASTINEESQVHNQLLSTIDANVDGTIAGLREETKHAQAARKESGVCYLYTTIIGLFSLMIFLIVIGTS